MYIIVLHLSTLVNVKHRNNSLYWCLFGQVFSSLDSLTGTSSENSIISVNISEQLHGHNVISEAITPH